jgi:regulator of sigma E protease
MIEVVQSVLALIVTLSILVTIHEFGHYWVARLCNVHVLRFSVGFGKPFYMKRGKPPEAVEVPEGQVVRTRANEPLEGTEFAVAAIPLGGYVKMLDEREGFVPDDQLHLAFNRKPVLQRIAITAAGPIANFLLAILAYWVLFAVGVTGVVPRLGEIAPDSMAGQAGLGKGDEIVAVDGSSVDTWSDVNLRLFERLGESGYITITVADGLDFSRDHVIPISDWLRGAEQPYPATELGLQLFYPHIPALIGSLVEGGRAQGAGLQVGDEVIGVDGEAIADWTAWVEVIQASPEKRIELEVLRQGNVVLIDVRPASIERDGKRLGFIGASRPPIEMPADMQRQVSYPVLLAIVPAMEKTWDVTLFTLGSIKKMIVGAISTKNLSGPITIAQVANATAQSGLESFVSFIALLSISLGVLNLLPIPVLDGGHLLYYTIELIARRPIPERVQLWGLQMGMFVIVGIMLLAFYNDLARL